MSPRMTVYLILLMIVALVVVRVFRRIQRRRAARAQTLPPQPPVPVAPEPSVPVVPEPLVTAPVAMEPVPEPVAVTAPEPEPVPTPRPVVSPYAPASFEPVYIPPTHSGATPEVFAGLGKKRPTSTPLPRVEAEDTPLADTGDLVFGPVTPLLAALLPESETRGKDVRKELRNAGYYEPHALMNLSAVRYVGIMAPMLLMGALLIVVPEPLERFVIAGLVIFPLIGWSMPRLVVKSKAADRTSQIERAMPDMLDMMNMCVSQGMTVPAALKRVNQELPAVHPALYKELQIVSDQAHIGTMQQALQNFSERVDVPEVHSFTSLLVQTERMGTSVSSALAEYSDNMRAAIKQRADEKGNQAAFKLLFPTVLCLMPAVYLFLMGPSVIELTNFLNREDGSRAQVNSIIQRTGQPSPQQARQTR